MYYNDKKSYNLLNSFYVPGTLSRAYMNYLTVLHNNSMKDKPLLFLLLHTRTLGIRSVRWLEKARAPVSAGLEQ